jgi:hypothetical protein
VNVDEFENLYDIGKTESLVKGNKEITSQKLCESCHESCAKCDGPLKSECVDCEPDYDKIIIGSNVQCIRKMSENFSANEVENYSALKVVLIILLIGVLLLITCISFYVICRHIGFNPATTTPQRDNPKTFSGISYNKIRQQNKEVLVVKLPNLMSDDDDSDESEI